MQFVRTRGMERREWEDDEVHNVFDNRTVDEAAYEWIFDQERQTAAYEVIDGSCAGGNEEVQADAQNIRGWALMKSLRSQEAGGDD